MSLTGVLRVLSVFRPGVSSYLHAVYIGAALLSVMVAHVIFVISPQSGLADRIIAPVARGLELADTHWKSVLILVAPFFAPVARDLVPRLRRIWGIEFDAVQLEPVALRERAHMPPGERQ